MKKLALIGIFLFLSINAYSDSISLMPSSSHSTIIYGGKDIVKPQPIAPTANVTV